MKKLFLNDKFILILIIFNSLLLFTDGYIISETDLKLLTLLDNLITFLFIVEALFKIKAFSFRGYMSSGWNLFDFSLVVISIPALIAFVFRTEVFDFSFLLVFRILRVFRAFKFFRFIPNIDQLISGVQRAMKASIFVFIGFAIYIFIIGILSYYLFNASGSEYFDNPLISLYSTFKIFTVEGWFEIPEAIIGGYSNAGIFFTYVYFIFVVLTGGIFGLSIVNSIFVDTMVSDNNDDVELKLDNLDTKVNEILTKINSNETRKNIG